MVNNRAWRASGGGAGDKKMAPCNDGVTRGLVCAWGDSNPHVVRHQILSLARLPLRHMRKRGAKVGIISGICKLFGGRGGGQGGDEGVKAYPALTGRVAPGMVDIVGCRGSELES